MNEEVVGPVHGGYFVAAYPCQLTDSPDEYVGYFKIFTVKPENYWEQAGCILKGRAPMHSATEDAAVASAIGYATNTVRNFPAVDRFEEFRVQRLALLVRK